MAEAARDASVETLPASPRFVAVRIAVIALLIPIFWLWLGTGAAIATAVVLAPLLALFAPRALVLGGSDLSDLLNDRLAKAREGVTPWS